MKNILITGASSGIGKALYKEFQKERNKIVLGLSRRGPDIRCDLSQSIEEIKTTVERTLKQIQFDLVINCAGIMPFNESKKVFDVNFWGVYNLSTIFYVKKMFKPYACIINIASISGMIAEKELPIYGASKAAVISLTKSLAKMWSPDIRVNCISPGFYKSNLVQGETPKELIKNIPMGYEENPLELFHIIQAIWKTKYMTGTNIVIDGGVIL